MEIYLGMDIGSVALKLVALGSDRTLKYADYRRLHGQPSDILQNSLDDLKNKINIDSVRGVVITGSGAHVAQNLVGGEIINEILTVSRTASELIPEVNTLIEMGGADSKLLCYSHSGDQLALTDFAMNSLCAAGTGSFLDQQANRLKVKIEEEFGTLALKSKHPPRIAGRCSVFAKSDMIHLQQIATPDYDIVAGLCYAVARNFKSAIARGKKIIKPIAFVGGVASNAGMIKAFEDILELEPGELVIPEQHRIFGAYGSALLALEKKIGADFDLTVQKMSSRKRRELADIKTREKLVYSYPDQKHYKTTLTLKRGPEPQVTEGYLGVDIGSLSTNLVVIDKDYNVIARRYLMTEGRPIEAVRRGLKEIGTELGDSIKIIGCGTTGSGRYLIGDFIGADAVRNEITAQARAAIQIDRRVDTIFEIGGQDSKYIAIDDGVVVDFEMNKACAAGTGSFLQEQAEKLNIKINEEFGERALASHCPVGCGERCTVFMESDLTSYQQAGVEKDDLVAGLAYSIAANYLTRVVQKRRIGEHVFFQGGVAWNKGVVAAFEKILGKSITVPPHHDVTGAIGAAIIAMEQGDGEQSRFRGFDLSDRKYTVESFTCEDCSNMCEVREVKIEGEKPLYYGSRCEKYDAEAKTVDNDRFDFYKFRKKKLYSSVIRQSATKKEQVIGFPRVLIFHELYPFWASFFRSLGYKVILSAPTNQRMLSYSLENFSAETCFPIKVVNGHIRELLNKDVDYIFLPSIIHMSENGTPHENSFFCPYVQSIPYTIRANFDLEKTNTELVTVPFSMKMDKLQLTSALRQLKSDFSINDDDYNRAIETAYDSQQSFYKAMADKGREFLEKRDKSKPAICIISRPYNGCDDALSLEIPRKLLDLGVEVMPMEALPLTSNFDKLTEANMYWRYGQRILAAAEIIRDIPNLYPVYITNFGCGPDSFVMHFFHERLGGKPWLQLEIDEHSADAGIVTRLEAFLDSLEGKIGREEYAHKDRVAPRLKPGERTVYVPYMSDHAIAFAAAMRAVGTPAEALPEPDSIALEYGKKYTSGKECFPCQVTTGDILRKIHSEDFDREKSAFFMPSASGPCRFGQYHLYQRQILDEIGYDDVPIVSPNSRTGYDDITLGSDDFQTLAWRSLLGTDLLFKLYHRFRPYQKDKTEIDQLYRRYLHKLADHIEHRRELEPFFVSALADFKSFGNGSGESFPVIGVVGEIFLRANRFSNNFLIDHLENLGAEVWLAPMAEWIFYTNFTYRLRTREENRLGEFFGANIKNFIQHKEEHKLVELLADEIPAAYDPPVEEIIELAQPYIDVSFSGEAILSIGKAIEYCHKGAGGVVNVLPFNCMPGTIVSAISKKVSEDLGDLPWLNLAYEGLSDQGDDLRLEAFVHQVRQFSKLKSSV